MVVAVRPSDSIPDPRTRMAAEVRTGLQARPRSLPSKYFYDDRGSELFEAITKLPEYYQTRAEEALLASVADDIIAWTQPEELVELGSGAGRKIMLLLEAMRRAGLSRRIRLFDINASFLRLAAGRLQRQDPGVVVSGAVGDFTEDLAELGDGDGRLAILFGGTIGNFHPGDATAFLRRLARQLKSGDHFLVGVDVVKDSGRLEAAYNDTAGVTAKFNRNILHHINRVLDADFDVESFEHVAFWDPRQQWIEMRLRAVRPHHVRIVAARLDVKFAAGDEIRTEISCKYTRRTLGERLRGTGFTLERWLTDQENLFALALLRRTS